MEYYTKLLDGEKGLQELDVSYYPVYLPVYMCLQKYYLMPKFFFIFWMEVVF